VVRPVFLNGTASALCHGCPNLGREDTCPPAALPLYEQIRADRTIWAVWNIYPLGLHIAWMRQKHPAWSDRQLRCCLYWQPLARRFLRVAIAEFYHLGRPGPVHVVGCPEAAGVNVTTTLERIGIVLEWPPVNSVYQIVLVGTEVGA
jgi:hypothetical protein